MEIKDGMLYINGEAQVIKGVPYPKLIKTTQNGAYSAIGIHAENPGCYKYLDKVLICDDKTGSTQEILAYSILAGNCRYNDPAAQLKRIRAKGNGFVVESDIAKAYINAEIAFMPAPKAGDAVTPKLDINKMHTCFDYQITDDLGVIMKLKKDVPVSHQLMWDGFSMQYNAYKIWGTSSQKYLMCINIDSGECWTVSSGTSTTMTSDYVWTRKKKLERCIKEVFPNHPFYRDQVILTKIEEDQK